MTVRSLQQSDIPRLEAMAKASGFPYPNINDAKVEAVFVVDDADGRPVMAMAAERIVQLYLYSEPGMTPHESLAAIQVMIGPMGDVLRAKGYHGVEVFVPPSISRRFGKRLEKTFGFTRNWLSWNRGI